MLSVNEINMLQAQNEGLRKQNAELQKENKRLKKAVDDKNKFLESIGINASGEMKRVNLIISTLQQKLNKVKDLIEAAVDADRTKTMAASLNCLYKALEIIKNE